MEKDKVHWKKKVFFLLLILPWAFLEMTLVEISSLLNRKRRTEEEQKKMQEKPFLLRFLFLSTTLCFQVKVQTSHTFYDKEGDLYHFLKINLFKKSVFPLFSCPIFKYIPYLRFSQSFLPMLMQFLTYMIRNKLLTNKVWEVCTMTIRFFFISLHPLG